MIESIPFHTLSEYVAAIKALSRRWRTRPGNIWYRGMDDADLALLPSTLWRGVDIETEESMVAEFLVYYRSYYRREPMRGLELYVLMRHYGLPTRLLDWSMSALVSLFFALEHRPEGGRKPVVWAMDHVELNRLAVHRKGSIIPRVSVEGFANAWLPRMLRDSGEDEVPDTVFAFKHPMSNPRIYAQKGCFTFHGRIRESIEQLFESAGGQRLAKLVLADPGRRDEVLGELYDLGFKEDDIYQDLTALTRRILREHGFEP